MVSIINVLYVVIDAFLIALGIMVAFYWGRTGLLAKTLWLLVMGIICYSVGDILWLVSDEAGGMGLIQSVGEGIWEIQLADVSYMLAYILWSVAFILPVRHILRQPKREQIFKEKTEEKVQSTSKGTTQ